jgi:hypothetical protein
MAGAVVALSAVDLSFLGEVLGRIRGAGRRATAPRADFYPPAASGVSPILQGSDIRTIGINSRKGV